jgi:hypothetical protein
MNYTEFYTNAKRRSIETLISMWAVGNEYSGLYCTTQSGVKCTIESGAKCTTF